jgi:ferritin-like metal-binding protein YciE
MKTLADAFEHTLQDIYWAENALVKALPKVSKSANNPELKAAVDEHLKETKGHVKTLEAVFKSIGKEANGEKCDAMDGLIKEADGLMEEASGHALDVGLIGAAQAVEHYEIARYGTLREWAKELGHDEAHTLLSSILDEEKAANNKLTALAVTAVNSAKSAKTPA